MKLKIKNYLILGTLNALIVDHPLFMHVLRIYMKYIHEKRVVYYLSV